MSSCFIPFSSPINIDDLPTSLNDPFSIEIPVIAKRAVTELQSFLSLNEKKWQHNFGTDPAHQLLAKGKMFGVLVVKNKKNEWGYLATFSGKILDEPHPTHFVPSLFDVTTDDSFITKGMLELKGISEEILKTESETLISELKVKRKSKSFALQHQLFESYVFLNANGVSKSLTTIFEDFNHKIPPAGAGECSAPKLLHYAFKHDLKPIAIAEFWWGKSNKSGTREHLSYYPACRDKCVPILGFMLMI